MIHYEDIKIADLAELQLIFKRAFDDNLIVNKGVEEKGPAGYADGKILRDYALNPSCISKKIMKDEKIIGAYAVEQDMGEYSLKLLCVDPDYKNEGIGARAWHDIEEKYFKARKWYVKIPSYSERDKYFYINKCGFHLLREMIKANGEKDVILLKEEER